MRVTITVRSYEPDSLATLESARGNPTGSLSQLNSMRAYEPENDKQNHAVCVPQPSCLDVLEIIVLPRNKHEVRKRPILGSSLLNRLAPLLESTKPASHDELPTLHMVTPPEIWTRGQETLQATFDIGNSDAVTRGWGRDSPNNVQDSRRRRS